MGGFEELYRTQGRAVYRFLLALSGDEALAEELLQETFYQAFLHIDQFEGRSSLYTWLCRIGKNAWLKECRRRNRYADAPIEELTLPARQGNPEEEALRAEELRRIRRAVVQLPEPLGEVFILHTFGEMKLCDIAALLGKSESWARVTYFRARKEIIHEASL